MIRSAVYAVTRQDQRCTPTTKPKRTRGCFPAKDDRKPRDHGDRETEHAQDGQDHVVRQGQQPLKQREKPVQLRRVWILEVERNALGFIGQRILVCHQRRVDADSGRESRPLKVEVEPPARVPFLKRSITTSGSVVVPASSPSTIQLRISRKSRKKVLTWPTPCSGNSTS